MDAAIGTGGARGLSILGAEGGGWISTSASATQDVLLALLVVVLLQVALLVVVLLLVALLVSVMAPYREK